jgi:iron complex outermembrane receptor protein
VKELPVTSTRYLPRIASTRRPNPRLAAAVSIALGCAPQLLAAAQSDSLEEVVVTASRREQNLLDVPYNISAVSGQSLQAAGITSLTDISRVLPGINVPDLGPRASSSNSNIVIRGLNANDPGGSAYLPWESVPLVSTYVDEVPLFVNLDLFDVQRVEVLRGPQGTLYGSGAVAGTIKVIHNPPDPSKFAAEVSADGSSTSHAANGSYTTNGMLNIPIGETAALRANVGYKEISGFINASNAVVFDKNYQPVLANPSNPLTSNFATQTLKDIDSAISTYARAEILWHATSAFDASLAYQRQDDHSNAFSRQMQGLAYTDAVFIPLAPDHRIVNLYALTLTGDLGFATVTSSTSFADNGDQSGYDQSPFLLEFNANPLIYGSYPRSTTEFFTDYKDKSFVEELRLVSKAGSDWDYTVGGFFRREINDLFQYETIPGFAAWSELPGSANAINQVLGSNYASFGDFVQLYNGGTRPSALAPTDTNYTYARNSGFKDRAIYGELTRHLTPEWQITAGVRVFWQDVNQSLYQTIPYGGPYFSTLPPPANLTDALGTTITSGDQKFHKHLFKFNTSYRVTPTLHAYATYSEGFRHGGANASAIGTCVFCDSPNTASFQPDTVKNYEIGLKGTADNWLRFSGDIYRMRWSDIQIQLFDYSGSAYVANGGEALSQGIELELEGQLGRGWSAMLGYGYTDAKVTGDFTIIDRPDIPGNPPVLVAHNGDRLPYVPKQTLTAGLNYTHPVASAVTLDLHADAAYRSDVTTQINASASGYRQLGGFTTVGASATLRFGAAWRTRLYVNNLTNIQGVSAAGPVLRNADAYAPNYREEYVIRPRTVGLMLTYRFE